MRDPARSLFILEILICFLPLSLLLLVGVVMFPGELMRLFQRPPEWNGSFGFVVSVMCGLIGLWTLYRVVSALLDGKQTIERPERALCGVALGALPLIIQLVSTLSFEGEGRTRWGEFIALVCLPLLATTHVLYLGRHLFIASFRRS